MKKLGLLLFYIAGMVGSAMAQSGGVGIGVINPDASAVIDVSSTTKGMLIPRMNSIQRNSISNPAVGLLVFDNTTGSFWFKSSTNWIELVDTLNNAWKKNSNTIYAPNDNNVGIGVNNHSSKLGVNGDIGLHNGASIYGQIRRMNDADLNINATTGSTSAGTLPGDLFLQIGSFPVTTAGRVGIGTITPATKLDVAGDIRASGKIMRAASGNANMVPVCYGIVNTQTGQVTGGSGNFTVTETAFFPIFNIDVEGITVNPTTDVILVTLVGGLADFHIMEPGIGATYDFRVFLSGTSAITHFSFVVYKF